MRRTRTAVILIAAAGLTIAAPVQPGAAHPAASVFTGSMSGSPLPLVGLGSAQWSVASDQGVNSFSASGVLTGTCTEAVGNGHAGILTPDGSHGGPVTWVIVGRTAVLTGTWERSSWRIAQVRSPERRSWWPRT